MTGSIITSYDAIRMKCGVTANDLPDTDLDSVGLVPIAEALVESLITDWSAIMLAGGANKVFLQAGAVCIAGALAVVKLQVQRGQSFKLVDYQESETKVDWDKMREALLKEGKGYLYLISTHGAITRTKLLIASGPTSSSANWPSQVDQWFARIHPHIITWLSDDGMKKNSWENNP